MQEGAVVPGKGDGSRGVAMFELGLKNQELSLKHTASSALKDFTLLLLYKNSNKTSPRLPSVSRTYPYGNSARVYQQAPGACW